MCLCVLVELLEKVDKTMYSDLTDAMKEKLVWSLPKSRHTAKDDVIPVTAELKARKQACVLDFSGSWPGYSLFVCV